MNPQDESIDQTLRDRFGLTHFRGCQRDVITHLLSGRHAMLLMPTGMGKSLCYQLPAVLKSSIPAAEGGDREGAGDRDLTIVLSPLIALMKDQVDSLVGKGIPATYINSLLDRDCRRSRQQALIDGDYRLLFVTPERFRKPEFLAAIRTRTIRLLAIDEAHCVSQWGHDFRPDYSRLSEIRGLLGNPTTLASTATATARCRSDICQQIGIASDEMKLFCEGIDRPNLELDVTPVLDESEKLVELDRLLRDPILSGGTAVVYFTLIKTLQRFSDHLLRAGIDHVSYHGELPRGVRQSVQDDFVGGRVDLVLATPAFGMGIDKSDIRMVIHAETPGSIESYYQEIGRAGRDGRPSRCVWLYDQADLMTQMQFIEWSNPDAEFYLRLHDTLTSSSEQAKAFGLPWLNDRLQRVSRHDHRLETAIAMLERYSVIAGTRPPRCFDVIAPLPDRFTDNAVLAEKKRCDQRRLYELVKFAATEPAARQKFLNDYFAA